MLHTTFGILNEERELHPTRAQPSHPYFNALLHKVRTTSCIGGESWGVELSNTHVIPWILGCSLNYWAASGKRKRVFLQLLVDFNQELNLLVCVPCSTFTQHGRSRYLTQIYRLSPNAEWLDEPPEFAAKNLLKPSLIISTAAFIILDVEEGRGCRKSRPDSAELLKCWFTRVWDRHVSVWQNTASHLWWKFYCRIKNTDDLCSCSKSQEGPE